MIQYQERYRTKLWAIIFIQNIYRNVLLSREARFETYRVVKIVKSLGNVCQIRLKDLGDAFEKVGEVSGKEKIEMIKIRGLMDQKIHHEMGKKGKKGKS